MTQPAKTRGRAASKKAYHHGDLRAALVTSALGVLEREGLGALSLRAVARAAGVSQAAPYHHFADKEALLAAVAARGFAQLSETMAAESAGAASAEERLEALGVAYVVFATANPALFKLMFGPDRVNVPDYPDLLEIASAAYGMIERAIADLREAAGVSNDAHEATIAAWSLVHGLSMLLIDGRIELQPGETPAALARHLARLVRLDQESGG